MNNRTGRNQTSEKLRFREIGKGFIVARSVGGSLPGRRLARAYVDQFDRTYVQVDGQFEQVTEEHCFLAA